MRRVWSIPLVCVVLLLSLQGRAANDFSITLERNPGLNPGPWYSVTIHSDGLVEYKGEADVRAEGRRQKHIPVPDVDRLIQKLRSEDFLHWEPKTFLCVDYPEVKIKATFDGQSKEVIEACREPGKVLTLAQEIDAVAGTEVWVHGVPRDSTAKTITPQTACSKCQSQLAKSEDNQPVPEQLTVADAPKTVREVSCFRSFTANSTMVDVVRKCGLPDAHLGSGLYIFVYCMNDGSKVTISTGDLKNLAIAHQERGRSELLLK